MKLRFMPLLSFAIVLSIPLLAYAETNTPDTTLDMPLDDESIKTYVDETMADKNQFIQLAELFDVNSDKLISSNEVKNLVDAGFFDTGSKIGSNDVPDAKLGMMYFTKADVNKDNLLDETEAPIFVEQLLREITTRKFKAMDVNGDGVYNQDDLPSKEEIDRKIQENMAKLDEAIKEMEAMDCNEMTKNLVAKFAAASREEDFFMADTDKNGCISKEEFVKFEYENQKKILEDKTLWSTVEDFQNTYDRDYGKDKKCLNKDEYVTDYIETLKKDWPVISCEN